MDIQTETRDDHQILVTAEIDTDTFESQKRRSAKRLAKRVKIAGFRPGKAPYNVIVKHLGEGAIIEDAIEKIIDEQYPKILEEKDITPYGPGSLENIESYDPPVFKFLIPLAPEVTLGNYEDIREDYEIKEVSDDDVMDTIKNVQDQHAVVEPVDRPVEENDMVNIVLSITDTDDDADNKELVVDRKLPVVIESEAKDASEEWPYEGFSRKLIGFTKGQQKTMTKTIKKGSPFEDLAGKKVKVKVIVEEIKGRTLPELDDEFAKTVTEFETLEEMKNEVRESLTEQYRNEAANAYHDKLLGLIVEDSEFKYPPQMLQEEIDNYFRNMENQLSQYGMQLETYLQSQGKTREEISEEITPNAEEQLKRSLVMMELANKENITVSEQEIQKRTEEFVNTVSQTFPPEEAKKYLTEETIRGMVSRIISDEMSKRTLERISLMAKGEYVPDEELEEEILDEVPEITDEDLKQEDGTEVPEEQHEEEEAEAEDKKEDESEE